MSIEAMNWAIGLRGLSLAEKCVLLLLANRHNADTGHCHPSIARIAEESGARRETVIAAIRRLEAVGFITTDRRSGVASAYFLHTSTTSTENRTGTEKRTSTEKRTAPVRKTVPEPVRKTVPEPKENPKEPKEKARAPDDALAFSGERVRLTATDFAKLAALYPLLDLAEELPQLDAELRDERKWWHALNAKLNYRNRRASNGGTVNRLGRDSGEDRSAAGKVRAASARDRAACA